MTNVLLTGIGGSIGVHVFSQIMQTTDWHVIGIDSFRHRGLTDRISFILGVYPYWAHRLKVFTHDLTAPISDGLLKKFGKIDYIINLAAYSDVQDSIDNPVPFIFNNVSIVTTMLTAARYLQPKAFIQVSTDEVAGPSGNDFAHPEWCPTIPSNPYSASKAAQESIAISYWRSYNIPLIICRTMNNFGEMQSSKKYPVIIQRKLQLGEQIEIHGTPKNIGSRYYIHSRNHADALIFILKRVRPHRHKDGQIDRPQMFNIVGDKRIDNLRLAQMIAEIMGKKLRFKFVNFHKIRPGHDRHYGLDGQRLTKLGWKPPIPFMKSLEYTVQWQQKHPEWMLY